MKSTRRKFIASAALAGIGLTTSSEAASNSAIKQGLVHHVFFWLKNPDSADDLNKLIEGVKSLQKIPAIKKLKVGLPAATTKRDVVDDSYHVSELIFFDDVKGQEVYQSHPIHLKFIEDCSPLWSKVVVYDSMDI